MTFKKGTKGIITAIICIACLTAILYFTISILFSNTYTVKHYSDPKVAKKVIKGTIYDSSGRILPEGYTSTKLLEETFKSYISPLPELNKDITYGSDIYLTLDPNLHYSLNLDCKRFYDSYKPKKLNVILLNYYTNEVIALATFGEENNTLLHSVNYNDRYINPKLVLDIKSSQTEYSEEKISQLNSSLISSEEIADSNTSVIKLDSSEKSYLLIVQTDNVRELLVYLQLMNEI